MGEAGAGALSLHCRHPLASLPLRLMPEHGGRGSSCWHRDPAWRQARPCCAWPSGRRSVRTEALPGRRCRGAAVQADG